MKTRKGKIGMDRRRSSSTVLTAKEVDRIRLGVMTQDGEFYGKPYSSIGRVFACGAWEVRCAVEGAREYEMLPGTHVAPVKMQLGALALPELGAIGEAMKAAGVLSASILADGVQNVMGAVTRMFQNTPSPESVNGQPILGVDNAKWRWGRDVKHTELAHLWRAYPEIGWVKSACGLGIQSNNFGRLVSDKSHPHCAHCARVFASFEVARQGTQWGARDVEQQQQPVKEEEQVMAYNTGNAGNAGTNMTPEQLQARKDEEMQKAIEAIRKMAPDKRTKKPGSPFWSPEDTTAWLLNRLKDGPVDSTVLYNEAWELGMPPTALKKSKTENRIQHQGKGMGRGKGYHTTWYLPNWKNMPTAYRPIPPEQPAPAPTPTPMPTLVVVEEPEIEVMGSVMSLDQAERTIDQMAADAGVHISSPPAAPTQAQLTHSAAEMEHRPVPAPVPAPAPALEPTPSGTPHNQLITNLLDAAWAMSGGDLREYGYYTNAQAKQIVGESHQEMLDLREMVHKAERAARAAVEEMRAAMDLVEDALDPITWVDDIQE